MGMHVVETRGMRIGDVGEVQPQFVGQICFVTDIAEVPRVGYYYHFSGLYYVDVWTSDGGYCLYQGDKFRKLEPAAAAALLGINPDQLSAPWRYRFPLGLVLLASFIGFLIYVDCKNRWYNWRRERRFRSLLNEPFYQRAIRQLDEAAPKEPPILSQPLLCDDPDRQTTAAATPEVLSLRFEHAVDNLADAGFARETAAQDLQFLMEELANRAL